MRKSFSGDTRTALTIYLALLAAALLIFFQGPFDRTLPENKTPADGAAVTQAPDTDPYEDPDKLVDIQPPESDPPVDEDAVVQIPVIESYEDLDKLIDIHPAEIDSSGFPITPVESMRTTTPERVDVDINDYSLVIDGLVSNPMELNYEEIINYPQTSEEVLLICPGFFADNAEWTGVRLQTLLADAEIMPEAQNITFYGRDIGAYDNKYNRTLLIDIIGQEGVLLAYEVNGQLLPPEHGYPLRLVAKGRKGFDWVKWLDRIEIN